MKKRSILLFAFALILLLTFVSCIPDRAADNSTGAELAGNSPADPEEGDGTGGGTQDMPAWDPDEYVRELAGTIDEDSAEKWGACGSRLKWFYSDHLLVVRGAGKMSSNPWKKEVEDEISTVVVEEGCTGICRDAFSEDGNIERVVLPDGMEEIGDRAFDNCRNLAYISLPDSLAAIGDNAFGGCVGLTEVSLGNKSVSIGENAFAFCDGRTVAPICTLTLGGEVRLGEVKKFIRLSDFQAIRLSPGDTDYVSVDGVIFSKDQTVLVYCPKTKSGSYVIPDSVMEIGDEAFKFCTDLTAIVIPDRVVDIGYEAFAWCTRLDTIEIPGSVSAIGEYAFEKCTGLTSVAMPDSITEIRDGTFYNCTGLREVVIPDGVISIGAYAFYTCAGLDEITIPDGVTSIGDGAFERCTGLREVTVPDSVAYIGDGAFYRCTGLNGAVIPSRSVLGESVLGGCDGLVGETENGQ